MFFQSTIVASALAGVALAAPFDINMGLSLVKTSPEDPGQWVTEKQKFEFLSKHIGFVDITNMKDQDLLKAFSTPAEERVRVKATYPSTLNHIDEVNEFIGQSSVDAPKEWIGKFTEFHTRHYQSESGLEAAEWLFETVQGVAAANPAITVEQFQHEWDQPSVIAKIPGSRSNSSDLVVAGCHMDSTSGTATSRAPGADDNASGSSVVLETLRVLAEAGFAPENTLEFHWYAAEEAGLLGSADVWSSYKQDGKSVLGYLNQDMVGLSPSNAPGLTTDNVDAGMVEYMRMIIKEYSGVDPIDTACGYACSDHASADANGFRKSLP